MNKDIFHIVQLESIPYLIESKNTSTKYSSTKYYCCKGKYITGYYKSKVNKKLFMYFGVNNYTWFQSLHRLTEYEVIEKVKSLTYFLYQIKQANPEIQFIINGKEI